MTQIAIVAEPGQGMDLCTHSHDSVTVVSVIGRLDAYTASALSNLLEKLVEESPRLVIDLSGVSFIDSTGLSVLVQGMKRCRVRQGDLRLCAARPPVDGIFALTRLDRTFQIFEVEAAAVASFDRTG